MSSIINNLNKDAKEIKEMLKILIIEHYKIINNEKESIGPLFGVFYKYGELSNEGKQLQREALKKYNRFKEILNLLTKDFSKQDIKKLELASVKVLNVIEQSKQPYWNSENKLLNYVSDYIDKQLKVLESLYNANNNTVMYVVDTNALLTNPEMENWKFDGVDEYTIVLLPTVLGELDKLKIDGRNNELREKAAHIIKKIKEYIRRGNIHEGVKLQGKNKIKSIVIEPNFDKTLSWLKPTNNDDIIIASCFEVVREYPNASVILVTKDINMQNKAVFANVDYCEPPEKN